MHPPTGQAPIDPDNIVVLRRGPGANCSSIGSALDLLFLSAVFGGAVLVAVAAAFPRAPRRKRPADPPPRNTEGESPGETDGGAGGGPKDDPPAGGIAAAPPQDGPALRARGEAFGAWIRLDDATLVGVDRTAAQRLGVEGAGDRAPDAPPPPIEVHLAVTSRCGAGCSGCYLDATPDGHAPPLEELAERLRAIGQAGAFTVAFGGGEPLSRPDLGELATIARAMGLTPVVTTSGIGMTRARAEGLRAFAQVNVSYDGEADVYTEVRGFDGAPAAERAMRLLAEAGVPFGVNVVLTRASFPRLSQTLERAAALGAREAQLLRYKPAGRAKSPGYLAARLSPEQVLELGPALERLVVEGPLPLRIDCAMLPLLSAHTLDPTRLRRFGVLGCEAGRHLAAVGVDGAVAPCSFGPATRATVESAWSIHERGGSGWEDNATLTQWRTLPEVEPCRSCPLREACRGGCRVVALHAPGGAAAPGAIRPDPECPRVRAFSAGEHASAASA